MTNTSNTSNDAIDERAGPSPTPVEPRVYWQPG